MNDSITNRQLSFMIFANIVGIGIINLPNDAATAAGTGSWIPLLINTGILLIFANLMSYLTYKHENQTLFEFSQKLMGKTFGKIITIVYILYFLIVLSYLTRYFSEIIMLIFLPRTPVWSISLFLLLVVGYGITKNLGTIARLTEIYVFLVIIGFLFIQIIVMTQGKLVNVRPLLGLEDLTTNLKATYNLVISFLGLEIILFIPLTQVKNKNIYKYISLMTIFIGLLYIFVVETTISVVGVEDIVFYKASMFMVLMGIDLTNLEILRRLDGFYIIFWTMNLFCNVSIISYVILDQTKRFLKYKTTNVCVFILLAIAFVLSQTPKTPIHMDFVKSIITNLGLVTSMLIPTILFIITKVKKNEK